MLFLTINPDSQHWSYAIVNFQNCLITLDIPLGMPASTLGIQQRLGIVKILKQVHSWAVSMQTARHERSRSFTFRVRVTCTQADGYQCGPHATAAILLFACNVDRDDKRASTVVAQDMRLWVAYMLWLHGDVSIKLPPLNAEHMALHQLFIHRQTLHRQFVSQRTREIRSMCPQLFMDLFLESCSQSNTAAGGLKPVIFHNNSLLLSWMNGVLVRENNLQ